MQKEILTKEIIKSDLKKQILRYFLRDFYIFIALLLPFWAISKLIIPSITTFVFCIILLFFTFKTIKHLYHLSNLKNYKFKISKDKLIRKNEQFFNNTSSINRRNFVLYFSNSRKYEIPHINNYKWSNLFCMPDSSVYNSSSEGDIFYIISFNSTKIYVAYNCKLFDLKD